MMTLTPLDAAPFEPTPKQPGDRVLSLHRVLVIDERGGAEVQAIDPADADQVPSHVHGWEVRTWAALVGIGVLCALVAWPS